MADRFDLINFGKSVVTTLGGTTANVNIDANTLFIDGTNNRVGVGTNAPTAALQVAGDIVSSGTVVPGSSFIRNRIINGAMEIAQRATTATGAYSSIFTYASVDRWAAFAGNASTTQAQSTDAPAGFRNSFRLQRPSGSTGFNALWLAQVIESVNCYDLSGQTVTLSFWAKRGANYSGSDLAVQFVTGTVADQGIANFFTWTGRQTPINAASPVTTTWTRYVFTTTLGAGVLEAAVVLNWIPAGGSTAGADDSVYFTGVQLEVGSVATPFERRQFGQEFMLCQRYFQRNGRVNGIWYSANQFRVIFQLPVVMRTSPILSIFDTNGYHEFWNQAGYTGISSLNPQITGPETVDVQITSSANRGRVFPDPALIERNVINITAEL